MTRQVNAAKLEFELGSSGHTISSFSKLTGLSRNTIHAAIRGRAVTFGTALKMQQGIELLRRVPRPPAVDRVDQIAPYAPRRIKKSSTVNNKPAELQEVNGGTSTGAS